MTTDWKMIARESSLIEHTCKHGVGHPDFYSASRLNYKLGFYEGYHVHGCDGCCWSSDFPGGEKTNMELMFRMTEQVERIIGKRLSVLQKNELHRWIAFTTHDLEVNRRNHEEA